MTDDLTALESIRVAGWTQGAVFEVVDPLHRDAKGHGPHRYIVLSHPCDVVSLSFERDPLVELAPATTIKEADGNFTFGKNPRRLHLTQHDHAIEVNVQDRFAVERRYLSGVRPDLMLSEQDRRVLAAWLAARYARPAFADEFNARLRGIIRPIEKLLRAGGRRITGIYVATEQDELPAEASYHVGVAVTMLQQDFDDGVTFAESSETVDELGALISGQDGIELLDIELMSEDTASLSLLRTFARWDYESMSFREGDGAAHPATGLL